MGSFGLTSPALRDVFFIVAIAFPVAVGLAVWKWSGRDRRSRLVRAAGAVVVCVLAQAAGVVAVFLSVNDSYDFYASYGDLVGHVGPAAAIRTDLPTGADQGRVRLITVHGRASRTTAQVLAWLPPQYDQPAYRHHRFPVVEFLPGQPGQPGSTFSSFHLASVAEMLIGTHRVQPFVMVVPPLMIRPPLDTECTDVPNGGPRALTWLTHDVPKGIRQHLRVQAPSRHWSVMGWSTGGFCAAKLVLQTSPAFAAAVSFGGYYQPITFHTYPHLLGRTRTQIKRTTNANSPQDLLLHFGFRGRHLLVVSGKQDRDSWPSSHRFIQAARFLPGLSYIAFPRGGHNLDDYPRYTRQAFLWLHRTGSLP